MDIEELSDLAIWVLDCKRSGLKSNCILLKAMEFAYLQVFL